MRIIGVNFNPSEAIALRARSSNLADVASALERLSTGKKINRASDDPAGSVAADNLKSEQASVLGKIRINQQSAYRYSAIDGGLSAVQDLLTELNSDIVASASTGGLSDTERKANQTNVDVIIDTLDHLSQSVTFNGEQILAPYIGAQATTSSGSTAGSLAALKTGGSLNLVTGDLEAAQKFVGGLSDFITGTRAALGAAQQSLDSENQSLSSRNENLSAAISQIVDTDYASEVGSLVRSQTLADAATFAVQLAQQLQAQTVLDLIRNDTKVRPLGSSTTA